ncbi:HNH endonuclease [Aquihabitans sp. McL0605]|uniref:HNH endonuclease signature motif containing protein n=1 Tax=Aquihabitans sp. McL0605 TaxID=3415671 RepID=UPI003CF23EA2
MFDDRRIDEVTAARRARAHDLVDRALGIDPATATGPELTAAIEARSELAAVVDGAVVAAIPQWEASLDWAADGCSSPVVAVVNRTGAHRSSAAALRRTGLDVAAMPHVSAAARAGRVPLSHLHLLARARRDEVAEVFDRDEAQLVAEAEARTADSLSAWLRAWRYGALEELGRNEPDSPPDHASEADTARIVTGFAGRGLVTIDLSAVSLAMWVEAIEARIETWRRAGALTEDTRTWEELVAAALDDLIADGSASSRRGQARPLLIVLAKLGELFDRADIPAEQREAWTARIVGGGPIGQAALRELMEQADLQLVVTDDDGEPLYVGRARRLATAAMLVALIARSGGTCEFPGCHARHHRSHAHHISWWRHGGPTDISNLALLCPHHHRLVHRGWEMTRGPTGLVFRRPDGTTVDPPPFRQAA